MKTQFSLKRLWHYAKADMVTNRRKYILSLSLVLVIAMGLHYINYLFLKNILTEIDGNINFKTTYQNVSLFLGIIITYYISTSFQRFYDKRSASNNIMLPVSNAEKFSYISIWNLLLYPAASIFVAWLVAQGWAWWFNIENNFIVFKDINDASELALIRYTVATTISLFVIFFVGSIIFRRMQYLLTILLIAVLFTLLIVLDNDADKTQFIMNNTGIIFICDAIMIGFVYWRFKRLQITK